MLIFSFSQVQGVKIDNLAEKKLCFLAVHSVSEWERVQIISCDANPLLGARSETAATVFAVSASSV